MDRSPDLLTTLEPPAERSGEQPEPKSETVALLPGEDDFDWRTDDSVICQEQPATAVYLNQRGSIVIRQERAWDVDEDTFVYLSSPDAAQAVISSIQRLLKGGL